MINEEHYNECRTILFRLIEKQSSVYKEDVLSKRSLTKRPESVVYTEGFDPSSFRESLINEISASDDFIKFYTKLTDMNYTDNFYLFGSTFHIDIKNELICILRFGLMMYNIVNRYDQIKNDFKNLYFSLYEDRFTIEIQTIMEHFDSVEIELLDQEQLNISIRKQHNVLQTYIKYRITNSKSHKNNYLQDPQTIIDIVTGIIRIYKSAKINYIMDSVKYSIGCPEFLKTESSLLASTMKDYIIKTDELQEFKGFFQRAYQSEEQIKMACGRESDYDKLLDLVFALEILFGKGDADSIKHRILIRLLNLISSVREVRKILYMRLNDLYSARSKIVHGLEKNTKFYTCIQNLGNYEETVRTAIRVFIDTILPLLFI